MKNLNRDFYSNYIIALVALVCFEYALLRANNLALSHDEALTYSIVADKSGWQDTANNHLLNTWLMKIPMLISESELALRSPNLFAHLLYLMVAVLMTLRIKSITLRVSTFVGLNLILPLLEFFSLARGYGLAHSFLLLSLFFLQKSMSMEENIKRNLFLATLFGWVATLGNLILINYCAALLVIFFIQGFLTGSKSTIGEGFKIGFSRILIPLALSLPFLIGVINWLFFLKSKNELYFGGQDSLLNSFFVSVFNASLQGLTLTTPLLNAIGIFFIVMFLVAVLTVFFDLKKKQIQFPSAVSIIMIIIVILSGVQSLIFKIPYPVDRTALFIAILSLISIFFSLAQLFDSKLLVLKIASFVSVLSLSVLISVIFLLKANLTNSYYFPGDTNTREVMRDISLISDPALPISLGVPWYTEPSASYYRNVYNLENRLNEITRDGIEKYEYSYYYAPIGDTSNIPVKKKLRFMKYYPEQQSVLLINPGHYRVVFTRDIQFQALNPPEQGDYSESSYQLPPIPAGHSIFLYWKAEEPINEQSKAHIVLFDPSDWRSTLVYHNQIVGLESRMQSTTKVNMPAPVINYRNWQKTHSLPALSIRLVELEFIEEK